MSFIEKTFISFLQTSLNASIMIALIMLILKIYKDKISTKIKYWIWILVVIRLIVPIIPGISIDIPEFIHESYNNIIENSREIKNEDIDSDFNISNEFEDENKWKKRNNKSFIFSANSKYSNENVFIIQVIKAVPIIWISIAVILCMIFFVSALMFKRKAEKIDYNKEPVIKETMNSVLKRVGINQQIPIYIQSRAQSPCINGFIHPKIYIPRYILKNDVTQLSHILLHEVMHYKRKDMFLNLLCVIGICIHWFNPLVWIAVNKVKLYMEYACDSSVLELLEEKEGIDYGLTLINISKMFLNKNNYSKIMICFEDKKQIKGRINMIKNFKKGSFKISRMAALGCLVCTAATITSGVQVKALDFDNVFTIENSVMYAKENGSQFLIDSYEKQYSDASKAQKIAGFNYKLPDYAAKNCRFSGGTIVEKISENNNLVKLSFSDEDADNYRINTKYEMYIFKGDPYETLKAERELSHKDNIYYDSNEENVYVQKEGGRTINGINGQVITIIEESSELDDMEAFKLVGKYFVWNEDDICYALQYNGTVKLEGKEEHVLGNLSDDDISNIAKSLKDIEDLKNVDYNKQSEVFVGITSLTDIYDKEDLEKAKSMMGFNPKFPLNIKDDIKTDGAMAFKDKNNDCVMEIDYSKGDKDIVLTATKHNDKYDEIEKNGSYNNKVYNKKIVYNGEKDDYTIKTVQPDKLTIDNKKVYKGKEEEDTVYIWKEDSVYYELVFCDQSNQDTDSIAQVFIESKENQ